MAVQGRALSATKLYGSEWSKRFAQNTKEIEIQKSTPAGYRIQTQFFQIVTTYFTLNFYRRISHVISYHFEDRNPHTFQACVLFVLLQGHNCTHSHTVAINTDSHTRTSWKNRTAHASSFANTITVTYQINSHTPLSVHLIQHTTKIIKNYNNSKLLWDVEI